eukprot:5097644-Pleurochrysis_carterae.AAC.1
MALIYLEKLFRTLKKSPKTVRLLVRYVCQARVQMSRVRHSTSCNQSLPQLKALLLAKLLLGILI